FRDLKSFRVGISINGINVGEEGQLPLAIHTADDANDFPAKAAEVRTESRQPTHTNDIYWVFALTLEIDDLVANVYASSQMIARFEQLRALNQITTVELACLTNEKNEQATFKNRLRDKLVAALETGQGLFRGVAHDGSALGRELPEI